MADKTFNPVEYNFVKLADERFSYRKELYDAQVRYAVSQLDNLIRTMLGCWVSGMTPCIILQQGEFIGIGAEEDKSEFPLVILRRENFQTRCPRHGFSLPGFPCCEEIK